MIKISPANISELKNINEIIEATILNWNLPERVIRLSLPSYRYNEVDLQYYEIVVAKQEKQIVAVASWQQADAKDTPEKKTGLLLHGLYVQAEKQNQGIGKTLLDLAEKTAHAKSLSGLLVKAQKDSVNFFIKAGMHEMQVSDPDKDYANRLWKDIK